MKATLNLATNLFKCIYGKIAKLFVYEFGERDDINNIVTFRRV